MVGYKTTKDDYKPTKVDEESTKGDSKSTKVDERTSKVDAPSSLRFFLHKRFSISGEKPTFDFQNSKR
ncbi:hypothetical protein [uncultured Draconibacterium sp.]|uniref:hypothetical protein n=1 Tax=uncultured Draconibacterium sp. TaxID=1573823 RepID=UPI0029C6EF42|nr:hypothetical protein [uncultured Draconibacterium sp.]